MRQLYGQGSAENPMALRQIILVTCLYAVELVAVIYFTRGTSRRIVGAFVGGAVAACFGICAIVLGNALRLWHVPIFWTPSFVGLFYLGLAISVTPIYLVTWRLARRFGWRGLAVFIFLVAVIGPPRDYLFAKTFPAWMVFAQGISPIIADAVTYIGIVAIGHVVMRIVAGPAVEDQLRDKS